MLHHRLIIYSGTRQLFSFPFVASIFDKQPSGNILGFMSFSRWYYGALRERILTPTWNPPSPLSQIPFWKFAQKRKSYKETAQGRWTWPTNVFSWKEFRSPSFRSSNDLAEFHPPLLPIIFLCPCRKWTWTTLINLSDVFSPNIKLPFCKKIPYIRYIVYCIREN